MQFLRLEEHYLIFCGAKMLFHTLWVRRRTSETSILLSGPGTEAMLTNEERMYMAWQFRLVQNHRMVRDPVASAQLKGSARGPSWEADGNC